jgi:hypothetical protein
MRSSLLFLILFCGSAWAQVDRSPLKIKRPNPQFDLLKENESITVMGEQTVQTNEPESRHLFTFSLGTMNANNLTLSSNGMTTKYDLSAQTPTVGAGFGYYPARFSGYWGLLSSIGYSFREQGNGAAANGASSSLHMLTTDILLSYRMEKTAHGWLKPYVGVGPGINVVLQRGIDELNTSEAKGLLVGALGVGFNIKRLFNMDSPLDWELALQYKRWIDLKPSNADYSGNMLSLGLSMIL